MTNYGFLIDQRKCIGCHACSTACKMENEVPLGVYRTWVKYVEVGTFPDTRRHFQVTRCNHCANPPCVRICPVTAMYQRDDGIVEFDPEVCIGCKACLQACPYDAIYIDPETHSAAKCHYCSHRIEVGLEPACVIVCPEEAIISGDLDDPHSKISRLVAREPVSVRKPEQGTAPKLFYIDATGYTLNPTASNTQNTYMWADVASDQAQSMATLTAQNVFRKGNAAHGERLQAQSGVPIRAPRQQAMGYDHNVLFSSGKPAEQMVQTAYNAQHKIPWHWQVPAYLVTKGIGSGIFITLALAPILPIGLPSPIHAVGLFVSLLFTALTTLLLVLDLEKPKTFLRILTRPQWRSWLTRGAFALIGFSLITGLWWLAEMGDVLGILPASGLGVARNFWGWVGLPFAVLAAIYTAFLFAQAEGRDLWQSPLLPTHLLAQAIMVGSGTLFFISGLLNPAIGFMGMEPIIFLIALVADLFITLVGEFMIPHASENAARAAHAISHGKYRGWFWGGSIIVGHIVPIIATLFATGHEPWSFAAAAVAVITAIVGLFAYEYAFVMAPQEVPNS